MRKTHEDNVSRRSYRQDGKGDYGHGLDVAFQIPPDSIEGLSDVQFVSIADSDPEGFGRLENESE